MVVLPCALKYVVYFIKNISLPVLYLSDVNSLRRPLLWSRYTQGGAKPSGGNEAGLYLVTILKDT